MRALRLSLVLAGLVSAAPAFAGDVSVSNGWFRAMPANLPAGGYFTLHNGGPKAVSLTGASSPACGMLMLHKSTVASGMSSMSDVESIPVPAGATLSFAPGGYHLMCMSPALKIGARTPVTLQLSGGKTISTTFTVKNAKGQ